MRLVYLLLTVALIWAILIWGGVLERLVQSTQSQETVVDTEFQKLGIQPGGSPIQKAEKLKGFVENRYSSLEEYENQMLKKDE